jgi:hypothetical protein
VVADSSVTMPVDSNSPIGVPNCGQLAISPRRRVDPHSIASSTEPPHSPPTPMPWITRNTTSNSGAANPIVA